MTEDFEERATDWAEHYFHVICKKLNQLIESDRVVAETDLLATRYKAWCFGSALKPAKKLHTCRLCTSLPTIVFITARTKFSTLF